jgi:hypothetical protein
LTPDTATTPAELAALLAKQLEDAAIPYAIGGAVAYGFWGAPRGTQDLDLNIFLAAEDAGPAVDLLIASGVQLDRSRALATARERGDARGLYGDMPVDIFFLSIPLHESAAQRTVAVHLLGHSVRILSAEDLVIFKLLFFRGKDIVDIERVLAVRGAELDRDYVGRWLIDCVGTDDLRVARWEELCRALPAN